MTGAGAPGQTLVVRAGVYCRISRDWDGAGKGCGPPGGRLPGDRRPARLDRRRPLHRQRHGSKHSKRTRRKAYDRLLADIQAGRIDAVVIWMEDRLLRQVIELAEFLKVCDAAGLTRIASAGGEFDLSDADQRTMLFVKAAIAEPRLRS